jgi:hypothetical protein
MVARKFVRDRRDTANFRYEGKLVIRGRPVSVAVIFRDPSLAQIPQLYLLDRRRDLPQALAHIEEGDRVCYVREEELVLDPLNPRASVALCLFKMGETLERISSDELRQEIEAEFAQHWQGSRVYIDLPADATKAAYFTVPRGAGVIHVIAQSAGSLARLGLSAEEVTVCKKGSVPVTLLSHWGQLTLAAQTRLPSTLDELFVWLRFLDTRLVDRLVAGLVQAWPNELLFLVQARNGSVGGVLILPAILAKSIQRPQFLARSLVSWAKKIEVQRLSGTRMDAEFVYSRNLVGRANLGGKRVALVGVGTIGGLLAKLLAQSGAGTAGGQLILIDPQNLEPGNVGRHWLGLHYVGMNKALGARQELSRTNLDCEVRAIPDSVLSRIADLMYCDLVVDATGERALSDVLNREFVQARREGRTRSACLHVWLVGSGVAVQGLLVDKPEFACFRCLRLDDPADERFRLLKPGHPATLIPAACGEGAYFAYGVGASAVASGLAAQMCLEWANGEPTPRLRTIRLNHEATFRVKDSDAAAREKCPACGTG